MLPRWLLPALCLSLLPGCGRQEAYQACSYQLPCGSDAPLCLANTTATGRTVLFCSRRCTTPAATSSDCPNNGACVTLNGMDRVCMKRCTAASDCDFANAECRVLPESLGATVCAARP
ncbi:MAG: hypothetical protein HY909_20560 [Deltaproteobacteria bacterium]|nr:hypothetical protein [Deltaproteobacteria bacterium]